MNKPSPFSEASSNRVSFTLAYSAATLAASLALAALVGCDDSTSAAATNTLQATPVFEDVGTKVIYGTYQDMSGRAATLQAAVNKFDSTGAQADLLAAKQAWRDARRPWEQSEAFLLGPVETIGVDPSIDSWPVNKTDLDAVLSGSAALTKDYVDKQEGTLKGFHTIEYLLFGQGNKKDSADFTARQKEYLNGVTASFKGAIDQLLQAWSPTGGNFLAQLQTAGNGSTNYPSQKAAMQELVKGMIDICDEVANGKIGDPFSQNNRSLEESQFSDNSNSDFADNIRSVQNVYLGKYGSLSGHGVNEVIASLKPELDTRLKQEIQDAIDAIGQMTPSFGDAISNNKGKVQAAQAAIQKVKDALEGEVQPLFAN